MMSLMKKNKLSAGIREGLKNKVKKHNEKYGDKPGKRVNLKNVISSI